MSGSQWLAVSHEAVKVFDHPRHSTVACGRLLNRMLLEPKQLLESLAPEGWHRSALLQVFHPAPQQLAEERAALRRNLRTLFGQSDSAAAEEAHASAAGRDDAAAERHSASAKPIEPEREIVELLGGALWDVFSNNHRVIDAQGTAYDLGSFRGSAGFIAESINRRYTQCRRSYDYMDFYMGTIWYSGRADLRPIYRWIFTRLQDEGCRWIYSFPRLHVVDLAEPAREDDDLAGYDPSEAVRAQLEQAERSHEVRAFAEQLDRAHAEAVRKARHAHLPATVAAYRDVFGTLPEGWPHPEM